MNSVDTAAADAAGTRGTSPAAAARFKVSLQLSGLDLRETESYLRIPEELSEVGFAAKGPISYLTVVKEGVPASEMVFEAADCARSVSKAMPGVRVPRVYEEQVGYAQIASRCAVAPEAVRLWATGKRRATVPFPDARDAIAQGSSGKLAPQFAWSEVLTWVREVLGIDPEPGVRYLDAVLIADLNVELAHLTDAPSPVGSLPGTWRQIPAARDVIETAPVHRTSASVAASEGIIRNIDDRLAEHTLVTRRSHRRALR